MIARAIAPKPKILMFDEATSALDNVTQKLVSDSLEAIPHNSRLTPYAPLQRLRHTICAPKMLDNTQSQLVEKPQFAFVGGGVLDAPLYAAKQETSL